MSRHPEQPTEWRTIDQAAALCFRAPRTIQNLISKHQLPVRRGWFVHNRQRRRVILLAPQTVAQLQALTVLALSAQERRNRQK